MAPPPVNEASPLNKGKKLDRQEISPRMSSEIGQDERDFENERKLFNKRAMKSSPGMTQAMTNENFPSNDCICFFV